MAVERTLFASQLRDLLQKAIELYGDRPVLIDDPDTTLAFICANLGRGHADIENCFLLFTGGYYLNEDGEEILGKMKIESNNLKK